MIFPKQSVPGAIDAVTYFTTNLADNTDDNLMCIFTYLPRFKQTMVVAICANMAGVEKAPAYDRWLAMPNLIGDTMKMTTVRDMACEYNAEADQNVVMFTLSFKNDARILTKASELHDQLVQDLTVLIPEGDFTTQCAFHPLPKLFAQHSVEAGGNAMGVSSPSYIPRGVLFVGYISILTPDLFSDRTLRARRYRLCSRRIPKDRRTGSCRVSYGRKMGSGCRELRPIHPWHARMAVCQLRRSESGPLGKLRREGHQIT